MHDFSMGEFWAIPEVTPRMSVDLDTFFHPITWLLACMLTSTEPPLSQKRFWVSKNVVSEHKRRGSNTDGKIYWPYLTVTLTGWGGARCCVRITAFHIQGMRPENAIVQFWNQCSVISFNQPICRVLYRVAVKCVCCMCGVLCGVLCLSDQWMFGHFSFRFVQFRFMFHFGLVVVVRGRSRCYACASRRCCPCGIELQFGGRPCQTRGRYCALSASMSLRQSKPL